jgi:hypothetical protein
MLPSLLGLQTPSIITFPFSIHTRHLLALTSHSSNFMMPLFSFFCFPLFIHLDNEEVGVDESLLFWSMEKSKIISHYENV